MPTAHRGCTTWRTCWTGGGDYAAIASSCLSPIRMSFITEPSARSPGCMSRAADVERARAAIVRLDGVEEVFTREEAAVIYSHPPDRIGDLSVASDARTALGTSAAKHDLSVLAGPLRSHGGRHEQIVPIIVSHPLSPLTPSATGMA